MEMEDFLLLYSKIMTGKEVGLKRPGREVVVQSPRDPSIGFCATVCPVLALTEDHKDLLPAKPLPCCVHSSLPSPPAPRLPPPSCCGGIQTLALSGGLCTAENLTEGQPVDSLFVAVWNPNWA